MQKADVYQEIDLPELNEDSMNLICGFEGYTDPTSEFLSLSVEEKEFAQHFDSKQDYSVPFYNDEEQEEYLKQGDIQDENGEI